MAFVCPKADGEWYKFNDDVVTKCSADEAIEKNFGNNCRTPNAYILVYIKESSTHNILCDVPESDVVSRKLIETELTKEIDVLSSSSQCLEVIVFTPESLQYAGQFKRDQLLFDPARAVAKSFYIRKDKCFQDLIGMFIKAFCTLGEESFALWTLNLAKQFANRFKTDPDFKQASIQQVCNKNRIHMFVETLSFQEPQIFGDTKHAMIFIKEYDNVSDRVTFHSQRYFELDEKVEQIHAYIRNDIGFDGDNEKLAIIFEEGYGNCYIARWLDVNQSIRKNVCKRNETYMAMVVFENLGHNRRPKYISPVRSNTSVETSVVNSSKREPVAKPEVIENGIFVTVKANQFAGEQILSKEFESSSPLNKITDILSELYVSKPLFAHL